MGLAADFVSQFVDPLDSFVTEGVSNLAGALEGPLYAGATLYIVIFGILVVLGYVRAPIQDFVINVIKIVIIVTLVTQVGEYNFYVKDLFFTQLPDGISQALGQVQGSSTSPQAVQSGAAFDTLVTQVLSLAEEIRKEGSWRNWYPIIMAVVFGVVASIVSIILLALVLFAKVALALVLVIGPIFIALALFRVTQPFFSSWLAAAVNFVLLQVLVLALITLMVSILTDFISSASGQDLGTQIVMAYRVLGLFALSIYLALQIPDIAARISGGGLALGSGLTHAAISAVARFAGRGIGAGTRSLGTALQRARGGNSIQQG